MAWSDLFTEVLSGSDSSSVWIQRFLQEIGLGYDPNPDFTVIARDQRGEIAGTGSLSGSLVKHMAVAREYQGSGVSEVVFEEICRRATQRGIRKLFAFTTPSSSLMLEGLGFRRVEGTSDAVLLEYVTIEGLAQGEGGISQYLDRLRRAAEKSAQLAARNDASAPSSDLPVSAIVMNANPFTLGHLHLVESAAQESRHVFLLVVSEDRSAFPTHVRERLIREGTRHLKNVTVAAGGDYIISQATFPMYFLRRRDRAAEVQSTLDATIFSRRIAPALDITVRYVGEEPYCDVTRAYNEAMNQVFRESGLSLRVIPRLQVNGKAISASDVRRALKEADWSAVADLVPLTTLRFLESQEADGIIERLRLADTPH